MKTADRGFRVSRSAMLRGVPTVTLLPILIYLVIVPMAMLLLSSFRPTGLPADPGFTLDNYIAVYSDPSTFRLMANSLLFSTGSTLIALLAGGGLAWVVTRTNVRAKRFLGAIALVPMAVPPVLMAIAWALLLSPSIGLFNTFLNAVGIPSLDIYGMGGMIWVEGLSLTPTAYLILSPAFRNMDPSLEEAAAVSGAGFLRTFRTIFFPLLRPAFFGAGAFLMIVGFVVFDIPGILGMPARVQVLSSAIYIRASPAAGLPKYGEISALAVSFIIILVVLATAYQRLAGGKRQKEFATVGGKGFRPRIVALRKGKYFAQGFAWLYFFFAVVAPITALLIVSFMPYYTKISITSLSRLTPENHLRILTNEAFAEATGNSLVITLVAASAVTIISALIAWVVVRSRAFGRRLLDTLSFLPLAIPNIMMGLALIYVYLAFKFLPVYGTIWIIVIALGTTYIAFGTRTMNGVLLQIHPELEEAAYASGASWTRMVSRITFPLVTPGLLAIWIWVAAHSMRELSASLMLQGLNNKTLPVLIWNYWEAGRQNAVAAGGIWLIVFVGVLIGLWAFFGKRIGMKE